MSNTHRTHVPLRGKPQQDHRPAGDTTLRRVWPDNPTPSTNRAASPQVAPHTKPTRPHPLNTKPPRAQKKHSTNRQTVSLTIWTHPRVKTELQRIADREGISLSAAGAAFLEKAIQSELHMQHAALLDTIIEKAIAKHMRSYSTRIAVLLVRVAFDTGQTRSLVTNILGRQPGVTPKILNTILDASSKAAKRNIITRTPQLESIITELEQLFTEDLQEKKA
jgi:hypothetical protein